MDADYERLRREIERRVGTTLGGKWIERSLTKDRSQRFANGRAQLDAVEAAFPG